MVKLKFLGAAQEVGRSAFLVDAGEKILLDYGVKLTPKETEYPLPIETNVKAAIISHAHMDHSGNLPHLYQRSSPISYMTPPTLDLARMLWFDTLKIAGLEAMDANFSKLEISRTEKHTFPVNYGRRMELFDNTFLEFFDAGHIAGSAISRITFRDGKTLIYTGDIKLDETRLHSGASLPRGDCDCLIIEGTYGDREHPPRKKEEKRFVESVQETVDNGGIALVSTFAVGRSAEILDILHEYNVNAEIFFDGMCQKAARIYMNYSKYIKDPHFLRKSLDRAHWVKNMAIRKKATKQPGVIVTTSGMLQGGPVYAYLPELYHDKNSKLFLTGFQVQETAGRILLETGRINLNGIMVEPKMSVEKYDFSSHAGRSELFRIIEAISPQKVVIVHSDREVMAKFRVSLSEKGFDAYTPGLGEELVV
ncbi:MAG: MBL fold metallo-hydrolase [Candidatus Diapherotrites archaeon]|nr:MBL fold metallo-hydrolase [Candidatus Diapherotrites archaeon]